MPSQLISICMFESNSSQAFCFKFPTESVYCFFDFVFVILIFVTECFCHFKPELGFNPSFNRAMVFDLEK